MTGVVAGSGGTGVLEGSRPGTGVTGGAAAPPTPLLIGVAQGNTPSLVTPSFTALTDRAFYVAAVTIGHLTASTTPGAATVTGMGLTWGSLGMYAYDSGGSARGRMDLLWAFGEATDGTLTVASSTGGGIGVVVFAIEMGDFPLNITAALMNTNPNVAACPTPEEYDTVIAIHGLLENGQPTTLDPAFTPVGESPANAQTVKTYVGFHKPPVPADNTFTNASLPVYTGAVFMMTVSALPVNPYANTIAGMDVLARYPLRVKGTAPDIADYETTIAPLDLMAQYPGQVKGTSPDTLQPYDTVIGTLTPSFYVEPGAKGAGSDPIAYDDTVDTLTPSFNVLPGPKGAGTDPANYDDELATFDRERYFQMEDSASVGPDLPNYDTLLATFTPDRYVRLDRINELAGAILALSPVGYFRMNEPGSTGVDTSGNGHDGTYSGDYTPQAETGPDGFDYVRFLSDFVGPGHGGRLSIPTTAVDGSFSPDGHGQTWVMLSKRDTPADLGYPIAKRTASSTDREYDMSYSSTDWRADAYDIDTNAMMNTTASNANTTAWELIVFRCPDLTVAAGDPFEIFADSSTALTPSTAESSDGNYAATDSPLGIGGFPDTISYGHNGAMAHVAVFDYELSDAQILTIVNAAIADGWIV